MTTDRRRSPRRKIVRIEKIGKWGSVTYHHHLSCGHTESRKRASSTDEIACPWCLKTEAKDKEMKALTRNPTVIAFDNELADEEIKIERARAAVAGRFGVPQDAVDIKSEDVFGSLIIRSATVYLSAQDVARVTNSQ
jgi:hypothetical protein